MQQKGDQGPAAVVCLGRCGAASMNRRGVPFYVEAVGSGRDLAGIWLDRHR